MDRELQRSVSQLVVSVSAAGGAGSVKQEEEEANVNGVIVKHLIDTRKSSSHLACAWISGSFSFGA